MGCGGIYMLDVYRVSSVCVLCRFVVKWQFCPVMLYYVSRHLNKNKYGVYISFTFNIDIDKIGRLPT